MMRGDLHIHSRYSDGSYSHGDALLRAKEAGLSFVSFTDHDTVAGSAAAVELGITMGISVIPGVEISAWDQASRHKVHILGYGYRPEASHITALCAPLLAARQANTLRQLALLQNAGYPISIELVRAAAHGAPVLYKQHLMRVLVDAGLDDDLYGPLYRSLFKGAGLAAGDIDYVDARDAVRAIVADGGLAVLAHPGQLDNWDAVPALVDAGLSGIEYLHESHRTADHRQVLFLAKKYGLLLAGGSDDHGSLGSSVHIGDLTAPPDILYALLERDHPALKTVLPLLSEAATRLRGAATQTPATETKDGNHQDLVTAWDREVETFLSGALAAAFPESRFLGEEQSGSAGWIGDTLPSGQIWILDPIDGTTNFAVAGRDYAISLALYVDGQPELALVLDCQRDQLYSAVAGGGAKIDGRPIRAQASVELAHPLGHVLLDISINSVLHLRDRGADFEKLSAEILGHRVSGCASLSICRVACGTLGAYLSIKLGLWDWAAARLIVAETGGASWQGPLQGPDRGIRSKRFYLAASSRQVGTAVLDHLTAAEYRAQVTLMD